MPITLTISEEDFCRIYLALWSHNREMWKDYSSEKEKWVQDAYLKNKELINWWKVKASRENIELP